MNTMNKHFSAALKEALASSNPVEYVDVYDFMAMYMAASF